MCGCLSSTVEKDSAAHYGDSRHYHCERRHQNCTARQHRFAADTGAGGDTCDIAPDNYVSYRRDNGTVRRSFDCFIGDSGGGHRGGDLHVGRHDVDPICKYYDVDHQRRDCGYFIAYHGDNSINSYFAVRHVDGGTYFEL
ncbi:uncharacterized protein LOC100572902 [Acyrthosiphon pisum]|uniref:Uncharacterized protein n=1 Tax=Acyrthosiphon pisum TaxID=7029 RepID=A0A8R2AAB9_ACYPI|nr:uncharacterized protein LOC100572902 [Acyrthosiphon pisum]|eukprot:XP_003240131.1 PREDICTED: uncharacterized protein LOC100572902 [Acyrthosiphon pisum]